MRAAFGGFVEPGGPEVLQLFLAAEIIFDGLLKKAPPGRL